MADKFVFRSGDDIPEEWLDDIARAYTVFGFVDTDDPDWLERYATEFGLLGRLIGKGRGGWKKGEKDPEWVKRKAAGQKGAGRFEETPDVFIKKEKRASTNVPRIPSKTVVKRRMEQRHHAKAYAGWERDGQGRVLMDYENVTKWMQGSQHQGKHSLLEHLEDAVDKNGNLMYEKDSDGNILYETDRNGDLVLDDAGKKKPVRRKVLSKEREQVHQQIVARQLKGVRRRKAGEQLKMLMLGGGPGSGKTSLLKAVKGFPSIRGIHDKDDGSEVDAAFVSADDYKMALPEWDKWSEATAGSFAHNESLLIADATKDAAQRSRMDVVLDGTGDMGSDIIDQKIDDAEKHGYETDAVYVTIPTGESMVRALVRGLETGRNLSLEHLGQTHRGVSHDYSEMYSTRDLPGGFKNMDLFDNDVPRGAEPIPIIRNGEIVDQKRYDDFLAKEQESLIDQIEEALARALDPDRHWDGFPKRGLSPDDVRNATIDILRKELLVAKDKELPPARRAPTPRRQRRKPPE